MRLYTKNIKTKYNFGKKSYGYKLTKTPIKVIECDVDELNSYEVEKMFDTFLKEKKLLEDGETFNLNGLQQCLQIRFISDSVLNFGKPPIMIMYRSHNYISIHTRDDFIIDVYKFFISRFFSIQYKTKLDNAKKISFNLILMLTSYFINKRKSLKDDLVHALHIKLKDLGTDFIFFKNEILSIIDKLEVSSNNTVTNLTVDDLKDNVLFTYIIHYTDFEYIRDFIVLNFLKKIGIQKIMELEDETLQAELLKLKKICLTHKDDYPEYFI